VRYMLLICDDEAEPLSPAEIIAHPEAKAWMTEVDRRGALRGGERLRPSVDATTVRVRDDDVLVTDGPFAETKEAVGGFNIIECDDLDEAIEIAAMHPCAKVGAVEVRPIWEL
jgi:hypothetical protein